MEEVNLQIQSNQETQQTGQLKNLGHVFFAIFFIVLGVFGHWLYREKIKAVPTVQEQEKMESGFDIPIIKQDKEPLEKTRSLSLEEVEQFGGFKGEFITARLPNSWSIIEYKDGKGAGPLGDGFYRGLTGLEVKNSLGEVLFQLKAVDGVGGVPVCENIYRFDSTNIDFTKKQTDQTRQSLEYAKSGSYSPQIIDLGRNYVKLVILGRKARRIGRVYYLNTSYKDIPFNSLCDEELFQVAFPVLSFEYLGLEMFGVEPKYRNDSYTVFFSRDAVENEYPALDEVLKSMKVK